MATTTANQQIPIPSETDTPDPPRDMALLAKFIEQQVIGIYTSTSDRDTRNTAGGAYVAPKEGQVAFTKDTNTFYLYDGAAWQQMYISIGVRVPQITNGTAAPTGGSNGDVYFKV